MATITVTEMATVAKFEDKTAAKNISNGCKIATVNTTTHNTTVAISEVENNTTAVNNTVTVSSATEDSASTITNAMTTVASSNTDDNTAPTSATTCNTDDSTTAMANLTLTIPLAMNQNHSSAKTLMGLPLELRNLIYHYTLVSPSKHNRGHLLDCPFRQGHTRTSIEPAACMVVELAVDLDEPDMYPWNMPNQCRCAKRRGLNLLLANRQVHRECARIFWTRNDFVFDHADEFTVCVGSRLREEYRPLLRSVYVGGPASYWEPARTTDTNLFTQEPLEQNIPRWNQFWGVLKQCLGLRRLALRPEVIKKHSADMKTLAKRLPELRRLEMTWLGRYKDQSVAGWRDWGNFRNCTDIQRDTIFVRAAQTVQIRGENAADLTPKGCKELYRGFTTNFCVYVDRIVREQFLGCPDADVIDFHGHLAAGLDETRTSYRVELPTGKTARIHFMGVPQSQKTRVRIAKEGMARDARLRAQGKPTAAEEKALKSIQWRKDDKREQEEASEEIERQNELIKRRLKADEMREDERRERQAQKAEVRRAAEEEKVQRRLARKRVTGKAVEEEEPEEEEETEVKEVPKQAPPKAGKEGREGKQKRSLGKTPVKKKRSGGQGKGHRRDELDWDAQW